MVEMEWYKKLKQLTKGMPPIDATPDMEMPSDEPPSADEVIVDMDDERLANAYHIASKWKAYCDFATGVYAAAEIAYAQRLGELRNQVYMENFGQKKPANVKIGEMTVDNDKRVRDALEMHNSMKQGRIMYDKRASQFAQLAMTYGNERKDRRERELRTGWDG